MSEFRLFRKMDMLLILLMAAAIISLFAASHVRGMAAIQRPHLEILVGNETYGVYDLQEEQTIPINDTNVCEIRDGNVQMIQAKCPDQTCVHMRPINEQGGTIVCLPNHVVLRVIDADSAEREVDSIAG